MTRSVAVRADDGDERFALGLMLAPVLLMALLLVSGKAIKPRFDMIALPETIALRWPVQVSPTPATIAGPRLRPPVDIAYVTAAPRLAPAAVATGRAVAISQDPPRLQPTPGVTRDVRLPVTAPAVVRPLVIGRLAEHYRVLAPHLPTGVSVPPLAQRYRAHTDKVAEALRALRPRMAALRPLSVAPPLVSIAPVRPDFAEPLYALPPMSAPIPIVPPGAVPDLIGPPVVPPIVGPAAPDVADGEAGVCRPETVAMLSPERRPLPLPGRTGLDQAQFGRALARAAEAQADDLVFYTATYRRVAYPRGDIASMHGSCSDVIIRALRVLGIDLQEQVQRARVGTGDTNIDHRRTETLRKLFEQFGASVPVTRFPEDYRPGDIVTYYRPYSRVSRAHIAIVSDRLAPTGRPMVIHNRGWGVQLEDALFADAITGHYRLTDALVPPEASPTLIAGAIGTPGVALRRSAASNPGQKVPGRY